MENCLFCRIVDHKVPSKIVFEDDLAMAFQDIHPQAPVHVLIIPKEHIDNLEAAGEGTSGLLGHLLLVSRDLARRLKLDGSGYRLLTNTGPNAGQSVYHLHFHLLGGRPMHWPPG